MTNNRLHVLADELVDTGLEGYYIADLDAEGRAVGLAAVDDYVTVSDQLACRPDCAYDTSSPANVVETLLEQLKKDFARVALAALGLLNSTAELFFEDAVVIAELLFFIETQAVVTQAASAETVDTVRVELALCSVLWRICDRCANTT